MKDSYQYIKSLAKTARILVILTMVLTVASLSARAQLNPFQGIFYQNQYLYNPAMAGMDNTLNISLGYRQQWNTFPGAPKTSSFTMDYQPTSLTGVGLNVADDQAGLIRQTRVMGTYAYHMPVGENNEKLNFGLSLGVDDSRLNYNNLVGDLSDLEIAQYNQLKPYVDGDLGMAYTSNDFSLGVAVPNLKAFFFGASDSRFDADRMQFMSLASYKIALQEDRTFVLQPVLAFRMIKGYDDIVDIGANFLMNNYGLDLQSIYHTSKNMSFGIGLNQPTYGVNLFYNIETGAINRYSRGTFELGLKLKLFKR